jgi:hypothetical protein
VRSLKQITIVVAPADGNQCDREFYRYDKFAEQLRLFTSAPVTVIEDEFAIPPPDGIILLDHYGEFARRKGSNNLDELIGSLAELWDSTLRRRIFCVNAARGNDALAMLEKLGLAGMIDPVDYQVAVREIGLGSSYGDSGLYGVRTVAEALGCTIDYARDRYCKATVPPFGTLGELLGRYLEAYWRTSQNRE